jgi:hypothetical protein
MISQDYSERFYPLDGSQRVMQAELARLARDPHARPRVWLHRQGPHDVQHPSTAMSAMSCRALPSGCRC